MNIPLSVLDLAPIRRGQSVSDSIAASVALAQRAEEHGYQRVWYAEHHNMPRIASSATSVLISHVGDPDPPASRGVTIGRVVHPREESVHPSVDDSACAA